MAVTLYDGCKLCNLIDVDADLWWETHRRIFDENLPYGNVATWLNGCIAERNRELPPERQIIEFNRTNFHNHFVKHKHVENMDQVREVCKAGFEWERQGEAPAPANAPILGDENQRTLLMSDANDFLRMKALIAAAERRLHAYNNQMTRKEKAAQGDEQVVDLQEVATFQKLISELLKLKKEAVKVEASSKVAGSAVKEAVSLIIENTLERVDSTAEEIHGILAREMPGSRLPQQINGILRSRIGDQMKLAIPDVLETVYGRYGIK